MTFIITKPGYYRTRDGKKARVVCVDTDNTDDTYSILYRTNAGEVRSCIQDGRYNVISDEHEYDIVAEWKDKPIVDWSAMPAWAKYVAMDESGEWWWYADLPCGGVDVWFNQCDSQYGRIPSEFAPSFCGDWKDSLVERPHA